jgi:ferredoxin
VAIDSDRGFSTLHKVTVQEVSEQDTADYLKTRGEIASGFGPDLEVKQLPNLLDIEFESDVWDKWGKKCLSCGSCSMVCPTCYCYGISEQVSMDFESVRQAAADRPSLDVESGRQGSTCFSSRSKEL